jgi:hypothetical protein
MSMVTGAIFCGVLGGLVATGFACRFLMGAAIGAVVGALAGRISPSENAVEK